MKRTSRSHALLALFALAFLFGCSEDKAALRVVVITDYVPGPQFDVVETEVFPFAVTGSGRGQSVGGNVIASAIAEARFGMPYAFGQTVAEFAALPASDLVVNVRLRSSDTGEIVGQRQTRTTLSDDYVLRVYIETACANVVCPAQGGSAENTECQAGRCVEPRCSPQDERGREFCQQVRFCNRETDCPAVNSCAIRSCIEGICVATATLPPICSADEWCDPSRGCLSGTGVIDDESQCGRLCFADETPCVIGFWNCEDGRLSCEELYRRPVGTECDVARVCSETGECVECLDGTNCRVGCKLGTVSCDPITGAPTCNLFVPDQNAPLDSACANDTAVCFSHTTCPGLGMCTATGLCEMSDIPEIVVGFPDAVDATQTRLFTDESGRTDRFSVRLAGVVGVDGANPDGRVVVTLSAQDEAGAPDSTEISLSSTTLEFTRANSGTEQIVTVTGLSDALNDGDVDFRVRLAVTTSSDARYSSLAVDIPGTNASVCPSGFGDCNGVVADGCETNIVTSNAHCGVCGNACDFPNASATCMSGACVIGACLDGFSDCDGDPRNGCEVRIGDACSLFEGCQTGTWACGDPELSGSNRAFCDVSFVAEPGTPCGSGSGFTCDDVGECNTCIEGDACTPAGGDACAGGVVSCATGRAVCSPTGGRRATNTSCGPRSVCSPTGVCTNMLITRGVVCGASPRNGNELCQAANPAFSGAVQVHGYSWGQCAGPMVAGSRNALGVVTADPCGTWSADGLECLDDFVGARDCTGMPFYYDADTGEGPRWGFRITELSGDGFVTFDAPSLIRYGCNGWNPGWSVRALCRFAE